MTSASLPMIWANASDEIESLLDGFEVENADLEAILQIAKRLRRRGLSALFLDCLVEDCLSDLQRSGALLAAAVERMPTSQQALGIMFPILDAIACEDWQTTQALAGNCTTDWNKDLEYEDDYLYMLVLISSFVKNEESEKLQPHLDRYQQLIEHRSDPRFEFVAALVHGDAADFDAAIEQLLEEHASQYQARMAAGTILEDDWATEGYCCIEALAWLRIAERRGWTRSSNYAYVPSVLFNAKLSAYDPNSWRLK